jgi:hypothetical protein
MEFLPESVALRDSNSRSITWNNHSGKSLSYMPAVFLRCKFPRIWASHGRTHVSHSWLTASLQTEEPEHLQAVDACTPEDALQQLFGLSPGESLVDELQCKLQQTYACSHNSHTPPIQMLFAGTLSLTDRHMCFLIEERGKQIPFKIAHAMVKGVVSQLATDGPSLLNVALKDGTSVVFSDFHDAEAMNSALALVEHLSESCNEF